uniref:Uncharacterized protein n=1 Tax=Ciona savignyi TaxID=51511 RepID=H2YD61_CIOSA
NKYLVEPQFHTSLLEKGRVLPQNRVLRNFPFLTIPPNMQDLKNHGKLVVLIVVAGLKEKTQHIILHS